MRIRTAALLLALPVSLSSCAIVAGTAAGVVLAQEVLDTNTYVVQLQQPAEIVWEEIKVSLSKQATGPLEVDEALMAAIGKVEGRTVTATVESFDQKSSRLTVDAKHYGVADGEIADQVTKQMIKDIEASVGSL
ncbi:MAG: hypothetical protein KDC14_06905 [Planctomycetes bacterium]|nr:hypothetical protein [Planctomycetota bacterium]